jgi:hypothetical protein
MDVREICCVGEESNSGQFPKAGLRNFTLQYSCRLPQYQLLLIADASSIVAGEFVIYNLRLHRKKRELECVWQYEEELC